MFIGIGIGIATTRGGPAGPDITAPTITSASTANCAENATLAHALTANEAVTWTITGGADAARFEISGSTLRWASNGTKNFESPNDANTDNAYVVQVTATDAALNASNQTVTITVTDVAEELFPDPNLEDVLDATNGWTLATATPAGGGLGPGISIEDSEMYSAELAGANLTTFNSAVTNSSTKTVAITFQNAVEAASVAVSIKNGTPVIFAVANGVATHSVTAGIGSGFLIEGGGEGTVTCEIVHISVT